jgi:hypothetical protein
MGAILTIYFLAFIAFLSGAIILVTADNAGKRVGAYLVVISIFLVIIGLFIYSSIFGDRGYGDV